MPGLSQLKQFSSDLVSLGDEITIRASRGEKPVAVEIPKTVEDKNDSEDFVLGMPEIEAEVEALPVDDDLSDLTGLGSSSSSSEKNDEPSPSFEAPDLSNLLNPVIPEEAAGGEMPDLSMFMEEETPEEEAVEEEPEEVSIADMGLDALLAGGGFGEEEPEEEQPEESEPLKEQDFTEVNDLDSLDETLEEPVSEVEEPVESVKTTNPMDELASNDNFSDIDLDVVAGSGSVKKDEPSLDDLLGNLDIGAPAEEKSAAPEENIDSLDELGDLGDLDDLGPVDEVEAVSEPVETTESAETESVEAFDDFDMPEAPADFGTEESVEPADAAETTETEGLDSLDDFDMPEAPADFGTEETVEPADAAETTETEGLDSLGDFDMPEAPADFGTEETVEPTDAAEVAETTETEGLDSLGDFDMPEAPADFGTEEPVDFGTEEVTETVEDSTEDSGIPAGLFDAGDLDSTEESGSFDLSVEDEIPDYGDDSAGLDDNSEDAGDFETDSSEPLEVFDTTEMEGLDFGIQDTDSQLQGGAEGDSFELGSNEDFAMEGEFEIPGFSDVSTAKEEKSTKTPLASSDKEKGKKSKKVKLPEPDFSEAEESDDLPPNTLSDSQYKQFLKNLSEYPLNVRLAFEDLIVQDEFTDDAEFEIIEKILNKAPARQVASLLEKMLDTSIPVPRDFEHRTAEEYEAYKKSLSYQLKNKIIPGILVGIVLIFVLRGLLYFGKYCIVNPLVANKHYKQGYVLLESGEYPQSESEFDYATKKRLSKKWFFKYARGYREHKQYQRAGKMYQNILYCFNHDKSAGLEYADMELNDLANYERAEEIVRREILDYHINDPDGILKLGDVFLEWGTEKDPDKLELAREQYATLYQLDSANDLYLSRMMRYFIRSNNLQQVLQLKQHFEPKEKSLCAEDWAELSGYLLEKYYGPLAPSEEYLRYEIEGLRGLLLRAVKTGPDNPIAHYNLANYFIESGETGPIEKTLQTAIEKFNSVSSMKKRDIYKYIDSYRLLGENYIATTDFLQAQEQFAEGILLYTTERDNAGFAGTPKIGKLYEDMGNIKYTISGDYDEALSNYKYSVELGNDTPQIRYRIGYIQYNNDNYIEALGSFMKAGDGNVKERNLLLAMANTLTLRGDAYAAQGYYNQLIETLDDQIAERGIVFPQANVKDYGIVNTYLHASNNYGVVLYKLAKRTGNSALNAQAIVQFSQSVRAWDALTRNQETLVRLPGSNLAEMNIQYITHPIPDFEPSVYTDIAKTLYDNEHL